MKTKEIKDKYQKEKSEKWHQRFMDLAVHISSWSKSKRLSVGCVIVKNGHIVSQGYNGLVKGVEGDIEDENGLSKITCAHAEFNGLTYMAREGISTKDCILYTTTSPCINCSMLIAACQVKEVYYKEEYKDLNGLEILKLAKIKVKKI